MPAKRQGEEYPAKSGIIITNKTNPSGKIAWRVDISAKRTGGQREQKQFKRKEAAQTYAAQRWKEIQSVGQRAFALTAPQREDAARAFELLAGTYLTLLDAVKLGLKHQQPAKERITVSQLRELFLASPARRHGKLIQRRPRSQGNQRARTLVFVSSCPESHANEITTEALKSWFSTREWNSPITRNNYRRAIHAMFSFAVTEGYCLTNPASKLPVFETPQKAPSILTIEHAEKLIAAAYATDGKLGLLGYITLGLFAGLRRAEIERLQWSAVKWPRLMVTIDGSIAKTGSIRNVALSNNAVVWLNLSLKKTGAVAPVNLNRRLRLLRFHAGLNGWDGNELRHSFASYHYDMHQNAPLTSAQLGHTSGSQLLFAHYRSLVPLGDGARFFDIRPPASCDEPQLALSAS